MMFWAGTCLGVTSKILSTTKNILGRFGPRDAGLESLRAALFQELLQAYKISEKTESEAVTGKNIDDAIEKAQGIRQIILEGDPRCIHRTIDIGQIEKVNGNLCQTFDDRALKRIQCSIEKFGLKNPPIARKIKGGFELVSGYLRYEACKRAGLVKIDVLVKKLHDREAAELALLDPLARNGQNYAEPARLNSILRFYNEILD